MDPQERAKPAEPLEFAQPPARAGKAWAGYLIAAVCLVWVFHDVRLAEIFRDTARIDWRFAALSMALNVVSYYCQGIRWSLLLHPLGRISWLRASEAVYSGMFVNEVLPLRLGEVVRIHIVAEWLQARFSAVLPSALVERLMDAVWLALAFGVTAIVVPLPAYLVRADEILGVVVVAGTVLFVFAVTRRAGSERVDAGANSGLWGRVRSLIGRLALGLRAIGRSRYLYGAAAASFGLLVFQVLAFWAGMLAYGIELSFWRGAAAALILHLGIVIPGAPSNVGTFQFFCVVGLTLFGIDKTTATGFSVVVFFLLTAPLWAIGMFTFGRSGLSLRRVRENISGWMRV